MTKVSKEYNYNPTQAFQNEIELSMLRNILEALPANATIKWSHDNYRISPYGVISSYLDVYAPELCDPLGINWLLTINNHLTEQYEDKFTFLLSENSVAQIHEILCEHHQTNLLTNDEIFLNPDKYMLASMDPQINWYQSNDLPLAELYYILDDKSLEKDVSLGLTPEELWNPDLVLLPFWSYELINLYLKEWSFQISDRTDIRFEFVETLSTPLLDSLKSIATSEEALYDIGDSIKVTGEAFDALLQMDEKASAAIMKKLKELK